MTPLYVLIIAFSIAFASQQVYYIRFKPFSCLMCLTAWLSGIIALYAGYGLNSGWFVPVGLLFGAIMDNGMKKYL